MFLALSSGYSFVTEAIVASSRPAFGSEAQYNYHNHQKGKQNCSIHDISLKNRTDETKI